MSDDLVIIYRARTPADAHLLRNVLEEAGIRAVVANDRLSGGAGVDVLGWPTEAQVQVAEHDAGPARAMALDFDRRQRTPAADTALPAAHEAAAAPWPTCPACGRRRTTSCPVCHTSGNTFPPADAGPEGESMEAADAMRLCTTCDEPFVPQYLPRCEWCGYVFEAAAPVAPRADTALVVPDRDLNTRVVIVAGVAVALLAGVLLYFLLLFGA